MSDWRSPLHALVEHLGLTRAGAELASARGAAAPALAEPRPSEAIAQVGRATGRDQKIRVLLGQLTRHPLAPQLLGLVLDELLLSRRLHEARIVHLDLAAEALFAPEPRTPALVGRTLADTVEADRAMIEAPPNECPDLLFHHIDVQFAELRPADRARRREEVESRWDDPAVRAEVALVTAWQDDDEVARGAVEPLVTAIVQGSPDPTVYATLVGRLDFAVEPSSLHQIRQAGAEVLRDLGLACWSTRLCLTAELLLGVASWLDPEDVPARFHLTELLVAEGRLERAGRVLRGHPAEGLLESPLAHWLEVGERLLEDAEGAPNAAVSAEELDRNRMLAVPHAWRLLRRGDASAALEALERTADLLPGWTMARRVHALGHVLAGQGGDEAWPAFDAAATERPFDLDLYRGLAALHGWHPELPRDLSLERVVAALGRAPYVRGLWRVLAELLEGDALGEALEADLPGDAANTEGGQGQLG
jgi:hypothetical protein